MVSCLAPFIQIWLQRCHRVQHSFSSTAFTKKEQKGKNEKDHLFFILAQPKSNDMNPQKEGEGKNERREDREEKQRREAEKRSREEKQRREAEKRRRGEERREEKRGVVHRHKCLAICKDQGVIVGLLEGKHHATSLARTCGGRQSKPERAEKEQRKSRERAEKEQRKSRERAEKEQRKSRESKQRKNRKKKVERGNQ